MEGTNLLLLSKLSVSGYPQNLSFSAVYAVWHDTERNFHFNKAN